MQKSEPHHFFLFFDDLTKYSLFLGVTIMLSITIYATIVGDTLPVSDAHPLIGQKPSIHIEIINTLSLSII